MTAMQVRPDELSSHLARGLAPLYVIHGDEPLTALEAGDAIRAAARKAGCDDRDVLVVEPGFKWDAFLAANANMGLFGSRKLVDLRIPTGKPGTDGGKALETYAANPNPDNVTLVTLPRLDRATQGSAWFAALAEAGVTIAVQPIDRAELPRWIAARLARQKQRAGRDVLDYLAAQCEGNLLAARQEIEKLALLLPEGELALEAVESATADVARYDVFQLSEAWLGGDAARALRILAVLRAEGEPVTLAVWQIAEDLHALCRVQVEARGGTSLATALRNARVWGRRQGAMERAARRVSADALAAMTTAAARLDSLSKGLGRGDAWDDLAALALTLAGTPARPLSAA
ncbi:MAG TPA: DNA polymerase III subunit delta [Casimicrobiaceae bacterium]|nr:DNA polymerase III subunit delta [Casimicrobiaceae bacterium]